MRSRLRRLMAFYRLHARLLLTWRPGRWAFLRRLVLSAVIAYVAFAAAVVAVRGITADHPASILAAVVLIGLVNLLLRPVILALAEPLGILALGALGTLLQFVLFLVVGIVVPGLDVVDPTAAVEGAVIFALVIVTLSSFIALSDEESYFSHLIRMLIREHAAAAPSDEPGTVFVQIDGLSHPVLVNQVRAGRVPTMARWVRSGSHRLTPWECRLPSQTSASQAGILLGANDGIPAFRWYEKASGRLLVSNRPADAAELEARLTSGRGLLAAAGASIGNLVSGDATEAILTMSRLRDPLVALGPRRSWLYFFASPFALARVVFLTAGEYVKELWQARRQAARGIEPRIARGGWYPLQRAVSSVLLREVSVAFLVERILRGVPRIYVDFVDYDEIAHYAGPERGEALDSLDGIDGVIGALERIAAEAPRPYRFVVLSDHGQSQGATFRQRYGRTVEEVIRELMGGRAPMRAATSTAEPWGPLNALATELARGAGVGARLLRRLFRSRTSEGSVELGPGRRERLAVQGEAAPTQAARHATAAERDPVTQVSAEGAPTHVAAEGAPTHVAAESGRRTQVAAGGAGTTPAARPELVVCASGNLALVYLNPPDAPPERLTLEAIEERYPGLIDGLAGHEGIGFVMVRSRDRGAVAIGRGGRHPLDDSTTGYGGPRPVEGTDPLAPFGPTAADDLRRLDAMPNVGDLVLNSLLDPDTQEVAAFEELVGNHGGLGGWQTRAFVLHPAEWPPPRDPLVGAPAVHRQLVAWLEGEPAIAAR